MTRTKDEHRLWAVLMSKQPPVPILADMLEAARAEGWEEGAQAYAETMWEANREPTNPYRRRT